MKKSYYLLRFLLVFLFCICIVNVAYAKKKIEPPYNPVEHKLPLKVSVEDYYSEERNKGYEGYIPPLVFRDYFKDDITINYIDTIQFPLGTLDIRCIFLELGGGGFNYDKIRFSFDIVDKNGNLVQAYIYYAEKQGGFRTNSATQASQNVMEMFRKAYIRDYEKIYSALQSPKPIKKATLIICDPSTEARDIKLKCFIELDGKRVGYILDKSFKSYEVTTGRHKIAAYYNRYWTSGFMNFTRSKNYTDDPDYARKRNTEKMDEYMWPTGIAERTIYIQEGENFVDTRQIIYGTDENANKTVSKDQVNEWLSLGLLENPTNNQQTTINLAAVPTVSTISSSNNQQTISAQPTTSSDVDVNISQAATKSRDTYVLIISNEQYEYLDKVNYATHDGEIFKEYCTKTLGIPEKQIFYYTNATFGKITDGVEKLKYCLNNFENSKAIVYYCGHGIPDEKTGQAYLIPVDGKGTNMTTCYSLKNLYKTLAATKAQSITYFMDACFTGANKEGSMLVAARGVAREPMKETLAGKTVVFSASSGDETAMTLEEQGHGLFTYYLLKKLQETEGNVTYGELADYINKNVKKDAFLINEKPQTPVVATSPAVVNTWKSMKLK